MKKVLFSLAIILIAFLMLAMPTMAVSAQSEEPPSASTTIESAFVDVVINGVPLALLPFGLVAYLKKQGVKDKALLFSSLGSGLVLGIGYIVYQTRPPAGDWWVVYGYWFGAVIYGLGLGLLASGIYEGVRGGVMSALTMVLNKAPIATLVKDPEPVDESK